MNVLCTICARGGSKGIIGKNLVKFNGLPLIAHSILIAKKINSIEKIYVSTDSDQIADISSEYGVKRFINNFLEIHT